MASEAFQNLIERYFSCAERQLTLQSGSTVLEQGDTNQRLYYVIEGELEGFDLETDGRKIKVFSAGRGAFIGVHSFFSGTDIASSTVIARSDLKLAWIDRETPAYMPEHYGPITSQFTPVIVNELSRRQKRATREAVAKEKAIEKLNLAEQMTTLGQLAAGLAHELNNAIGVVQSQSQRLESVILNLLEEAHPDASQFFDFGLMHGQKVTASEARRGGKEIANRYGLSPQTAKAMARVWPEGEVPKEWLIAPEEAVQFWQTGRDLHDLRLAANHTVGIVKSVKQLGRMDTLDETWLDINETLNQSVSLLQSDLRRVKVRMRPGELPQFKGSHTELVQVWVNIIKNACDAMEDRDNAELEIVTRQSKNRILVTIANNGAEIDEATRRKIFQPNFTTKKGGLSFGLGLGLSIVRRIVTGYEGSVVVKSEASRTVFRIKLPVEEHHG
ncbi:ATP-binding protein [Vibrio sonorensis]|uniref:ATP-binding protein n=1 Tax=Vibrio sonorensis TaxID=1004316 RepID=UPI0008D8E5D0|nr:ATP-binding protein [Vibrio sonorensis]